jgi:hypothetical protein
LLFNEKQLTFLRKALKNNHEYYQKIRALVVIDEISKKIQYPIRSFDDLVQKIDVTSPSISGFNIDPHDFRNVIPEDYFPVDNQEDLMDKAELLCNIVILGHSFADQPLQAEQLKPEQLPRLPSNFKFVPSAVSSIGGATVGELEYEQS